MSSAGTPGLDPADKFETISGEDVIKLQAVVILTFAQVLRDANIVELDSLAAVLLTHVNPTDEEDWAIIIRALANLLQRESRAAEKHLDALRPPHAKFGVVEGGLGSSGYSQQQSGKGS